jgi:6-phosphogluconate dehydrogenase
MQLAMIGLGRMGGNMTERLLRNGHQVVVYDRSADAIDKYAKLGATPAKDLKCVVGAVSSA